MNDQDIGLGTALAVAADVAPALAQFKLGKVTQVQLGTSLFQALAAHHVTTEQIAAFLQTHGALLEKVMGVVNA